MKQCVPARFETRDQDAKDSQGPETKIYGAWMVALHEVGVQMTLWNTPPAGAAAGWASPTGNRNR
jgi:hypothetical protein